MAHRTCLDCGEDIDHRHHNAKRCHQCSVINQQLVQSNQTTRHRACIVADDDCVPGRLRRDMCQRHYDWVKRYGVPERPVPVDHFTRYVITDDGCWQWDGPVYWNGYGHSPISTGDQLAHRAFYLHHAGPIPVGYDLDHLCHSRSTGCPGGVTCLHRLCVNPDDLEPVTRRVNVLRGYEARRDGMCQKGLHPIESDSDWYVDPSTGYRRCRGCWRASYRAAGTVYRAHLKSLT